MRRMLFGAMLAVLGGTFVQPPAAAQSVENFYRGKTLQIVVGFEAGGGYDLYARLVGRFLSKHLAGNPTAVVENMTGAGSRVAANWLYNVAPRDGTALGVVVQTTAFDQATRAEGVHFDAARFNWIGNPIIDNEIILAWRPAGFETMQDVIAKKGLICGGTGTATPTVILPLVINRLTGAAIRIIPGYPGGASITLAMQRGEVNCFGGNSWTSAKVGMAPFFKDKLISVLMQFGTQKDPDLAAYEGHDVPLVTEFTKTDLDRNVLDLIDSAFTMGRPFVAPPDVPVERVTALRRAFDATMQDPEFLNEAQNLGMEIKPAAGETLQSLAGQVVAARQDVLARARDLTDPGDIK